MRKQYRDLPHICEACGQLRLLVDLRVCEECREQAVEEVERGIYEPHDFIR
jgi:hypothetical protein